MSLVVTDTNWAVHEFLPTPTSATSGAPHAWWNLLMP